VGPDCPRGHAGRSEEATAEARRIVHRISQRGEVRQRHRTLDAGFGEIDSSSTTVMASPCGPSLNEFI